MKTILVADDRPFIRHSIRQMLDANPAYQVLEAADGAEALAQARQHRPDLVLLDVEMPELSGYEVCAALRADPGTRSLPILLMSAASGDVQGYALQAGGDGFFEKPFAADALLAKLKELLRE